MIAAYWRLAVAGFRKQSQYRLAMLAGLFANVVFGFVRTAVLLAAVTNSGSLSGYTAGSVGAYVWLSQGLLGAIRIIGPSAEIAERIKTGDVAIDLVRPVDIQASYLAADLGRAAFSLFPP